MLGGWRWQAIASPGHDPESVVLYQPELELLISADALWENGFGLVFPELEGVAAFDEVRATLDRLATLEVRWVIPGHGRPFGDFDAALARARHRLDGLVADPLRHARHAAKVLMKFHAMEVRTQGLDAFARWVEATPYMALVHRRFAAPAPLRDWWQGLLAELVASGALTLEGDRVENA